MTVTSLFTVPKWIPDGPNPVVIAGGGQAVSCWLLGNPQYGRNEGSSASASAGTSGWQLTDRTRQKQTTEWLDFPPLAMTMKMRVDTDRGDQNSPGNVDGDIAVLESFEVPSPGSAPQEPPILVLYGPIRHTELFWVCSRLTFLGGDDDVILNADGAPTMQQFTIELTEYSPSQVIQSALTPAQQAASVGASTLSLSNTTTAGILVASGKTYTIMAGDTLESIATTQLGNVAGWINIALLNGLGYGSILTPGKTLQLPAP